MDQNNQSSEDITNSDENAQSKRPSGKGGSSMFKLGAGIVIIAIIVFGAWFLLGDKSSDVKTSGDVVVIINGEDIASATFEEFFDNQKALMGELQGDIEEGVLRQQILDLFISKTLLLQKVEEENIAVTNEEINSQLSQIKAQFPDEEAFATALSEQGFTPESFASSLSEDLAIQKYISSQVDVDSVTVTDEEIQAEYDLAITKQDNLPGIDVLGDPIKSQILQQKQQQLVTQFVENLRSKSNVEIISG